MTEIRWLVEDTLNAILDGKQTNFVGQRIMAGYPGRQLRRVAASQLR